jgi:hypothetical protein
MPTEQERKEITVSSSTNSSGCYETYRLAYMERVALRRNPVGVHIPEFTPIFIILVYFFIFNYVHTFGVYT